MPIITPENGRAAPPLRAPTRTKGKKKNVSTVKITYLLKLYGHLSFIPSRHQTRCNNDSSGGNRGGQSTSDGAGLCGSGIKTGRLHLLLMTSWVRQPEKKQKKTSAAYLFFFSETNPFLGKTPSAAAAALVRDSVAMPLRRTALIIYIPIVTAFPDFSKKY